MKKILLALTIGLAAMGCIDIKLREGKQSDEYHPQLPPITQTGANTFGAVINGKVMVPRNSIGYVPPGNDHYAVDFFMSKDYMQILAADSRDTQRGWVYIYLKNTSGSDILPVGNYALYDGKGTLSSSTSDDNCITVVYKKHNSNSPIYSSIMDTGNVNITKSNDSIVSGTFSCKLRNKDNPNDIIEIKDGRFDFNKSTINTTNFY